MKKNILSLVTAITMATSFVAPAYASAPEAQVQTLEKLKINTISDDQNSRKVKVVDGVNSTIATFDKRSNTVTITEMNGQTSVINLNRSTQTPTLNSSQTNPIISIEDTKTLAERTETWWYYRYKCYTTDYYATLKWDINIDGGQYKSNVTESSSNSSDLTEFKKAVDSMGNSEIEFYALVTASVASATIAFLTGAETLGMSAIIGGLTALGCSVTAAYKAYAVYSSSKDADFYYYRVK